MRSGCGSRDGYGYGRIVNVVSVAGKEGNPIRRPMRSKAAVIVLTKSLGKETASNTDW